MTRSSWVALLCALLVCGAAAAEPEKQDAEQKAVGLDRRVAEKLLVANELLADDKPGEALEIVNALAQRRRLGPAELAQIHRFRGYIYLNQDKSEHAAAEFEKSLAQGALDAAAERSMTYSLAQLYTQLGKYDRALELIDAWFGTAEDPTPDAYYLKAMILVQQEKFAAAVEPAEQAVALSPQPKESWLQLLVAIHGNLKDYPKVAATLERLVALVPTKKVYWVQLAAVEHYLERDAEALARLQLARKAKLLDDDKEFRQLARLLYLREQPYECAQVIEQAIAAGEVEADADSYGLLSNCYLAAREAEAALAPLAQAAALSADGELYLLLGQIHLQREEYEPALDALGRSLTKAKPERRGAVQLLIGVAQLGTERFDEAERSFRAAQGDAKVRRAAESYLKVVQEQRAKQQQAPVRTASID